MLKRFFIWVCYNETLHVKKWIESLDDGRNVVFYELTFERFKRWRRLKLLPESTLRLRCYEDGKYISVIDGGFSDGTTLLIPFKGTDSAQISLSSGHYFYKVNGYRYKSRSFNNISITK